MAQKLDPLKGLNPNQSGPREKIQNGDPKASPNRDQRSGAYEAGGSGESLQKGPTGTPEGQVERPDTLEKTDRFTGNLMPSGIEDNTLPVGAYDRAGEGTLGDIKDTALAADNTTAEENDEIEAQGGEDPDKDGDDASEDGEETK